MDIVERAFGETIWLDSGGASSFVLMAFILNTSDFIRKIQLQCTPCLPNNPGKSNRVLFKMRTNIIYVIAKIIELTITTPA